MKIIFAFGPNLFSLKSITQTDSLLLLFSVFFRCRFRVVFKSKYSWLFFFRFTVRELNFGSCEFEKVSFIV